jgi:hypothetical protein
MLNEDGWRARLLVWPALDRELTSREYQQARAQNARGPRRFAELNSTFSIQHSTFRPRCRRAV